MRDHILTILRRLRRRMLAARAAEAAAAGGTVGGLTCAFVMAAWILAERFPATAAVLCAAPLLTGLVVAGWRRASLKFRLDAAMRWYLAGMTVGIGAAAMASVITGACVHLPKNWLFVMVPAAAAAAAVVAVARGASAAAVAAHVDERAALRERLSTAWELTQAGAESPFARAVRDQALAAASQRDLRSVSFWRRTPATLGALGLAVMAAALMLPWEPLRSPALLRQQRWQQVSAQAGRLLQHQLAKLELQQVGGGEIAAAVRRLQVLTRRLRSAEAADAGQWRGPVVDLAELAKALRGALQAGRLDPPTAEQVLQLIQTLQQVAAEIAEGMGESDSEYAAADAGESTQHPSTAPSQPALAGYATVYHPSYADLARPPTTHAASADGGEPKTAPAASGQVPYDQAWAAARRRAAEALSRQAVPAEYRQLVRDFFATDG